jgi:hypothetical protein
MSVDLLAEIAQSDALVARLLRDELRRDPPRRLVLVVIVLNCQARDQRVPGPFVMPIVNMMKNE